jgi:hypothetical protein
VFAIVVHAVVRFFGRLRSWSGRPVWWQKERTDCDDERKNKQDPNGF